MSEIGERIKQLRHSGGFTQQSFAKLMSISRSHVANLETGSTEPSEHLIALICAKLAISPLWLKYGEEPMSSDRPLFPGEKEEIAEGLRIRSGKRPFEQLNRGLHSFTQIFNTVAPMLADDLKLALKAKPEFCTPELIEKLRRLLIKKEGEPFLSAEKLLRKCDPNFQREKS
jgi:transcriptional regulator with XRE-family HTH domain